MLTEAISSFPFIQKTVPLTTTWLPSRWLLSVLIWEGSQLTIPSFQIPSTGFHRKLCWVLWLFAAGYWPTEPLLGKSHLLKTRDKKTPQRLVPGHQEGTFSSAFYPVCACLFLPQGTTPCFTEVDIKAHRAVPASRGPTHMHLFHHMSLFDVTTGTQP